MLDVGAQAIELIATPTYLTFLFAGVMLGTVVGFVPGMGGVVGMSIIVPFLFGMDPVSGMALFIGALTVIGTSDSFPAVLIGVPGSAGAQATIMDGYPLAKQGRAKEALSAAFFAAALGGIVGAVLLLGLILAVRPLLLALGSPQLFMLTLLGISLVGVLSRGAPLLGIISALVGALLGMVGTAPIIGDPRFTFGTSYLYGGIPLAVMAMGLFGLPEIIEVLAKRQSVARAEALEGGLGDGIRAVLRNRWLVLRSSAMGAAIGAIPGLGGAVVDWLVYGVAAQTSADNSNFGKGDIRGVIAPEAANNAKEGGAFLPTLLFGIPGSSTMAIMIGGLSLLGIQVGPQMVAVDLPLTVAMVWSLALANVIGATICIMFVKPISRLTTIRASRLMPFVLAALVLGAYQSSGSAGDFITLVAFGVIGWAMKYVGMARPPLLIGFVLSASAERYLHLSYSVYGWEWLRHPSVIALLVVTLLLSVGIPLLQRGERDPDINRPERDRNDDGNGSFVGSPTE